MKACTVFSIFLALVVVGCGDDGSPAQGGLGQACYPNGTCNAGLACQADECTSVFPDAGNPDGATPDGGGGTACDVVDQTGCDADQQCVIASTAGDTQCVPASGTAAVGDLCGSATDCTAGAACSLGVCRSFCHLSDGDPHCLPVSPTANAGVLFEPCDLFASDCPSGQACYLEIDLGHPVCEPAAGTGGQGDVCEISGECQPGFGCLPSHRCAQYCIGPDHLCPQMEQVCVGAELIYDVEQGITGVCVP